MKYQSPSYKLEDFPSFEIYMQYKKGEISEKECREKLLKLNKPWWKRLLSKWAKKLDI